MDTKTIVKRVVGWVLFLAIVPVLCVALRPAHRVDGGEDGLVLANIIVGLGVDVIFMGIVGFFWLLDWLFD